MEVPPSITYTDGGVSTRQEEPGGREASGGESRVSREGWRGLDGRTQLTADPPRGLLSPPRGQERDQEQ